MDRAQIRHVAELAELSLTEEEEAKLADDVGRILAYVKELDEVDVSAVPPTAHVGDVVPKGSGEGWRDDVVLPGLSHEDALREAPKAEHGGFAVPPFVS
jgi:aspartyl-tRNA(Asn)/glutamyl-tRNA(Gln) amidotransferase subunit C